MREFNRQAAGNAKKIFIFKNRCAGCLDSFGFCALNFVRKSL